MPLAVVLVLAIVVIALIGLAWGRSHRSGSFADPELDPRTSRRRMDEQFKKPPTEGGLL